MTNDNTLKTEAPKGEHTANEKVEKTVDIRKVLTPEEEIKEAERRIAEEEGNFEAPKGGETKVVEPEKTEEPKVELPERYKGKSADELAKLLEEKEKYIQSRSNEIGDWKQKVADAEKLNEKVAKIEEEAVKESLQPSKLPKRPEAPVITDTEYYDDPVKALQKQAKYNQELLDYIDQTTSAKTAPLYQTDIEKRRDKLYTELEDKYKDFPVKIDRKKVQDFLNKNPSYFTKYKANAYEQAYHDISATDFSELQKTNNEAMREQIKKEVIAEMKTQKQAGNVGLNDLETPGAGSKPEYDVDRMEDDPEYRASVLLDMEKRGR